MKQKRDGVGSSISLKVETTVAQIKRKISPLMKTNLKKEHRNILSFDLWSWALLTFMGATLKLVFNVLTNAEQKLILNRAQLIHIEYL